MMELRRLFALLMASDRKYLNPSTAIEILRHSFQANRSDSSSNGQQVSILFIDYKFLYNHDLSITSLFLWNKSCMACIKEVCLVLHCRLPVCSLNTYIYIPLSLLPMDASAA